MALRGQIPDELAVFVDPIKGVNLRSSEDDLQPGDARLMQNCIYDGGIRKRFGSTRLTPTSLGSFRIRGGAPFYTQSGTKYRLVAYGTRISHIDGAGAETILTSGMTSDKDTHFVTWPITDAAYISNGVDTLRVVNNTGTLSTVTGTNIPTPKMVQPLRDRLMAITNNGIERTNARVDNVWSLNSSWATLRPSLGGRFTAIYPYSFLSTTKDPIVTSLVAFQENAYYFITGSNFGTDVTAATPSTGEDSAILLRDANVGTSSPYSIVNVPGIGLFWFTTDLNVYWLPSGQTTGRYVGDRIWSNSATLGVNNVNKNALSQVVMVYNAPRRLLILALPVGSDVYPVIQYWMDMRSLIERPDIGPVWYGPMTGQTVGRMWLENQQGENVLYGGEGNVDTGAFIYTLSVQGVYTDAVGTSDTAIAMKYRTHFKDMTFSEREKYLRDVQMALSTYTGNATLSLYDLTGPIVSNVPIVAV